jgi:hypothetical protein
VDVALMFSNPLVAPNFQTRSWYPLDNLSHREERLLLNDSLSEAKRALSVRTYPATTDMLRVLLSNGASCLHFSGHGIFRHSGKDLLAFEQRDGAAHFVSSSTLRDLFQAGDDDNKVTPKLVFLASCHSREIGQALVTAGVQHVVCVQRREKIMDQSALIFSRAFYHALFSGEQSVAACFEIGRARVASDPKIPKTESEKFVLLTSQTQKTPPGPLFYEKPAGEWQNRSFQTAHRPNFPHIFSLFLGRNMEMHHVLSLLDKQRIVTVRGPPGIGKSSLCRAVGSFFHERYVFKHGVLYVSVRGCNTFSTFVHAILHAACSASDQTVDPGLETKMFTTDQEQDQLFRFLEDKHLLLLIDNCEDPINEDAVVIQNFLSTLLSRAQQVKLLVGSRCAIGGNIEENEKVYTLGSLPPLAAAKLFKASCPRSLRRVELRPTADANNKQALATGAARSPCGGGSSDLKTLARHPVLKFLGGHPQAIALVAPLLQDRSLNDLYSLLTTKSLNQLQVFGCREDEKQAVSRLVVSLEASIDTLRKTSRESLKLLCVMALLPGGAIDADLDAIIGERWKDMLHVLIRSSLIIRTKATLKGKVVNKYCTFPFITKFAEGFLFEAHEKRSFEDVNFLFKMVTAFRKRYASLSEELFMSMGLFERHNTAARTGQDYNTAHDLLEFYALNLESCLRPWQRDASNGGDATGASVSIASTYNAQDLETILTQQETEADVEHDTQDTPSSPLRMVRTTPLPKSAVKPHFKSKIPVLRKYKSQSTLQIAGQQTRKHNQQASLVRGGKGRSAAIPKMTSEASLAATYGSVLLLLGRAEDSLDIVNKGLALLRGDHPRKTKTQDIYGEANLRRLKGVLLSMRLKEQKLAKAELGTALILYKQSNCVLGTSVTLNALGFFHQKLQNLHGARTCYERARAGFEKLQMTRGMLNCYRWLATLNRKLPGAVCTQKSMEYFVMAGRLQSHMNRKQAEQGGSSSHWMGNDVNLHLSYATSPQQATSSQKADRPALQSSRFFSITPKLHKVLASSGGSSNGGSAELKFVNSFREAIENESLDTKVAAKLMIAKREKRKKAKANANKLSDDYKGISFRIRAKKYDALRRKSMLTDAVAEPTDAPSSAVVSGATGSRPTVARKQSTEEVDMKGLVPVPTTQTVQLDVPIGDLPASPSKRNQVIATAQKRGRLMRLKKKKTRTASSKRNSNKIASPMRKGKLVPPASPQRFKH